MTHDSYNVRSCHGTSAFGHYRPALWSAIFSRFPSQIASSHHLALSKNPLLFRLFSAAKAVRMRLLALFSYLFALVTLSPLAAATRLIESKSLNPCMENSNFTASLFNVVFTPDNKTLMLDINGVSSISGNIVAEVEVIAYGYTVMKQELDPCKMNLEGLCPMNTGQIDQKFNIPVPAEVIPKIPSMCCRL